MRRIILKILPENVFKDMDIWLFFGFLLVMPLSVRKIAWYMPLKGGFNEYMDVAVYLSDLFLIGTLVIWIIIQKHTLLNLSIFLKRFTWNKESGILVKFFIFVFPATLIIWAAFSLFYTISLIVGAYFLLKLIELFGLYIFIITRIVPRGTYEIKRISQVFIFTGIVESIIAIGQFFHQHSLGLTLIHESIVGTSVPGVAKIIINNEPYIRAYGTFPHPNVLGGFLLVSIICSHLYFKMFHVEQNQMKLWMFVVFILQYGALLVTFSKSAIIGVCVAFLYLKFVSRGTSRRSWGSFLKREWFQIKMRMFRVEQLYWKYVLMSVGGILLIMFWSQINVDIFLFQSLRERMGYQSIALDIIHNHPILGISCGQFVIFMSQQSIYPLFDWQLQPVHNVFLLIWAELGVVGFFLFTVWYCLLLTTPFYSQHPRRLVEGTSWGTVPCGTVPTALEGIYWRAMTVGFLPILLFDHYLWDIQQGQLLFWIVCGLLVGQIMYQYDRRV